MPKPVVLLISKLHGPPSTSVPLSAAEDRDLPRKRYVFDLRQGDLVQNSFIAPSVIWVRSYENVSSVESLSEPRYASTTCQLLRNV